MANISITNDEELLSAVQSILSTLAAYPRHTLEEYEPPMKVIRTTELIDLLSCDYPDEKLVQRLIVFLIRINALERVRMGSTDTHNAVGLKARGSALLDGDKLTIDECKSFRFDYSPQSTEIKRLGMQEDFAIADEIKLIEKIGAGGEAHIWRARDEALGRDVAVRILWGSNDAVISDARTLATIKHPNVVTVHGLKRIKHPEDEGYRLACILEYLEGPTLLARLKTDLFTKDELINIANGILAGLRAMHKTNIAHGDLHAKNIMLSTGGVKILDPLSRYVQTQFTTERLNQQYYLDLEGVKQIFVTMLGKAELSLTQVAPLTENLKHANSIQAIQETFEEIVAASTGDVHDAILKRAQDGFVPITASFNAIHEEHRIVFTILNKGSDFVRHVVVSCEELPSWSGAAYELISVSDRKIFKINTNRIFIGDGITLCFEYENKNGVKYRAVLNLKSVNGTMKPSDHNYFFNYKSEWIPLFPNY